MAKRTAAPEPLSLSKRPPPLRASDSDPAESAAVPMEQPTEELTDGPEVVNHKPAKSAELGVFSDEVVNQKPAKSAEVGVLSDEVVRTQPAETEMGVFGDEVANKESAETGVIGDKVVYQDQVLAAPPASTPQEDGWLAVNAALGRPATKRKLEVFLALMKAPHRIASSPYFDSLKRPGWLTRGELSKTEKKAYITVSFALKPHLVDAKASWEQMFNFHLMLRQHIKDHFQLEARSAEIHSFYNPKGRPLYWYQAHIPWNFRPLRPLRRHTSPRFCPREPRECRRTPQRQWRAAVRCQRKGNGASRLKYDLTNVRF